MRQLLLFVFIFVSCSTIQAQNKREIIPVEWKKVQKVAEKDPQKIKDLVARLTANEIDTTMTWNDRILAYYGQSYLTPLADISEGMHLDSLMREKRYEECLASAKTMLEKNPVSLKCLYNAAISITQLAKDSTNHHDVSVEEAKIYYNRMGRIFNTIAKTGYGTESEPFYVTSVSDEYMFMRYYLNLWEIEQQFMTGRCDGFNLKKMSEYYTRPQIFFEITRVLEMEKAMF